LNEKDFPAILNLFYMFQNITCPRIECVIEIKKGQLNHVLGTTNDRTEITNKQARQSRGTRAPPQYSDDGARP
jgi:hypothetical protein